MKDKNTAGILALLLGGFGLHKFYLNRPAQGLIYFIFCWTFIPALISCFEGITYLFNSQETFDQKYNSGIAIVAAKLENPTTELEKIGNLYEKGILTKEEFESKKEILLKKIA